MCIQWQVHEKQDKNQDLRRWQERKMCDPLPSRPQQSAHVQKVLCMWRCHVWKRLFSITPCEYANEHCPFYKSACMCTPYEKEYARHRELWRGGRGEVAATRCVWLVSCIWCTYTVCSCASINVSMYCRARATIQASACMYVCVYAYVSEHTEPMKQHTCNKLKVCLNPIRWSLNCAIRESCCDNFVYICTWPPLSTCSRPSSVMGLVHISRAQTNIASECACSRWSMYAYMA
jgi:hypothetical protein